MAKRKKSEEELEPKPKPAPKVGVSLAAMLAGVTLEKGTQKPEKKPHSVAHPAPPAPKTPAKLEAPPSAPVARPSATLRGGDRTIFYEAMAGVRRIDAAQTKRVGRVVASPAPASDPAEKQRDDEARARLRALVGEGTKFDVREDDDYVEGSAAGTPESVMRQLLRAAPSKNLPTLDLHGAKEHEVEVRVSRFVRAEKKKGEKRLLLIHGKGLHSGPEGARGRSILGRASVAALTAGGAAPLVRAFVSAPAALGGTGALLIELS